MHRQNAVCIPVTPRGATLSHPRRYARTPLAATHR